MNNYYENCPYPILMVESKNLSIRDVNKAGTSFYKYKKTDFINLNLRDLDHSFSDFHYANKINSSFVTEHILKDGTSRHVDVHVKKIKIKSEYYYYLFVHDVSEQLLKNQPPHFQNPNDRLFSSVIETVPTPLFIRNKERKVINCNSSFEEYFSVKINCITSKTIFDIFPDDLAKGLNKIDEEILSGRSVKVKEILITGSPDDQKIISVTENIVLDEFNEPAAFICVLTDTTELKRMECELERSLEHEKKLNHIKTRLLSTTSHEFRTPLTTILISSDMLAMVGRTCSDQKYTEQIIKIQNAVTYMTGLLDEILDINRTDRELWKFNPSLINLYEFCRKMVDEVSDQATPLHVLNYEYQYNSKHAIVDEKLLQHILTNLLSNAVKYSPNGGQIVLKVVQSQSTLNFILSDQGIGIPDQDKEYMFETFYRCRNAGKIKGTGLGLAIVKRSVEAHGGEIKFNSKINHGTTFTISIPLMTSI